MIKSVKSFGEIQENTHSSFTLVNCRRDFIYQMNYSMGRRIVFSEIQIGSGIMYYIA